MGGGDINCLNAKNDLTAVQRPTNHLITNGECGPINS